MNRGREADRQRLYRMAALAGAEKDGNVTALLDRAAETGSLDCEELADLLQGIITRTQWKTVQEAFRQ